MMRKHLIPFILLMTLLVVAIPLSTAETITFDPASITVSQGDTQTITLLLDSAPQGLAGYLFSVTINNPGTSRIMDVSYPAWAGLSKTTGAPGESITMSAVDLNRQVQTGATGVILGTITVQGGTAGTSTITVHNIQMDADGGNVINAAHQPGTVIVSMTGIPVTWTPAQTTAPLTAVTTATSSSGSLSSGSSGSGGEGGSSGVISSGTTSPLEVSGTTPATSAPATPVSMVVQTPIITDVQMPVTTMSTSAPATPPIMQQATPQGAAIIPGGSGIAGIPWLIWIVLIILIIVTLIILYLAVTKKI
jgi:hypothetical protein